MKVRTAAEKRNEVPELFGGQNSHDSRGHWTWGEMEMEKPCMVLPSWDNQLTGLARLI